MVGHKHPMIFGKSPPRVSAFSYVKGKSWKISKLGFPYCVCPTGFLGVLLMRGHEQTRKLTPSEHGLHVPGLALLDAKGQI